MGPSGGWTVILLCTVRPEIRHTHGRGDVDPYNLYTKTKVKPRRRNLLPNSTNLLLHVQRAHLQMTLWMAADHNSPPDMDMSNFGWEMNAGVLSPCIDPGLTGPPVLNTLPAKDGYLRLSASNACLPKTEISVFVTECFFFYIRMLRTTYVHIA